MWKKHGKKLIIILTVVIIIGIIIWNLSNNKTGLKKPKDELIEDLQIDSQVSVVDKQNIEKKEYNEKNNDKTVIKTENIGELELKQSTIYKSGDTSSLRNSDALGLNSAILARNGSIMNIESSKVTTDGKGSSAIASNGVGSTINVESTEIMTNGDRSRGILATGAASLSAENMKIQTNGYKSSAVATDTGGGKINISNSDIITNDEDSVAIYSTGTIVATKVNITTNKAEAVVIDGYNLADINNSDITTYKKRGALLIYTGPTQKQKTTGMLKIRNSKLQIKEGPAFYVTNTNGEIYLENNTISIASNKLLEVSVDKYGDLGQEHPVDNPTGGNVKLTAKNQTLKGDIDADSTSTVELVLQSSRYTGCINGKNEAQKIKIQMDKNSILSLTSDIYVNELNTEEGAQIIKNGFNIYVNGEKI